MKKLVRGLVTLGALALATGPASGQTFQNGPDYATPSWDQQIPGVPALYRAVELEQRGGARPAPGSALKA